ncbi:MAG: hypothetical protein HY735_28705 [Verrucomicrobia bacterium]|nr:hypothetical protein [Verrucomicrobiota bacterium]
MDQQDSDLKAIAAWLTAKDADIPQMSKEVFPLVVRRAIEALVGGQGDEANLRQDLLQRIEGDEEAKWLLVESLPGFWREKRVRKGSVDPRDFVERCADQVAALLVFTKLSHCVSANATRLDRFLLRRVADRVICRSVKKRARMQAIHRSSTGKAKPGDDRILEGSTEPTEEEVCTCVEAIWAVAAKFKYMGLGKAISYFKTAARRKLFPRTSKSVAATHELREELTPAQSADEKPDLGEALAEGWETLNSRLGPKHALRLWVLAALREDGRGLEWEEIASLLAQPGWCDGRNLCCPPDMMPHQVEAAFRDWATRSGTLSADNLRQTWKRSR